MKDKGSCFFFIPHPSSLIPHHPFFVLTHFPELPCPPSEPRHLPVLTAETLRLLNPVPGEPGSMPRWERADTPGSSWSELDATGRLIGLDQDPAMLELARPRLTGCHPVHANFDQLAEVLANLDVGTVDGVLADLGFCSDQLEEAGRGFSFREDGPLDMRLDPTGGETAAGLLDRLSEAALADVFWEYGEERYSRRIARKIVDDGNSRRWRRRRNWPTSCEVRPPPGGIDPATRSFRPCGSP